MGRAPCCDKTKVKKGPWSPDEDTTLKNYVERFGTGGNWIALPHKAGLKRCGKSCRLRWLNYLRPDIKHGGFTEEEDNIILTLYKNIGSRWSVIASHLPGRTDNDVKNYWNTKLKKKLLAAGNTTTTTPIKTTTKLENNSMHFNSSSSSSSSTPSPTTFVTKVENYYDSYCYGNSSSDCCNPMISTTFHPAMNANYQQNLAPQELVSDPRVQVSLPKLMEVPEIGPGTAEDTTFRAISSVQEVSSLPYYGLWFGNGGGEDGHEGFSLMGSTGSGFSYGLLNGFDFQERVNETFPKFANSF